MDWSSIARQVGAAAPALGAALGGPAGGAAGALVASALGVADEPEQVAAALKADPKAAVRLQRLEHEHHRELTRMTLEAETTRLAEINATMRAETVAEDRYVRRWRPTFGYATAATWCVQALATAYAMVANPEQAPEIIAAVTALTPMWGIALAVLGIQISKRSQDKQVAAGQHPLGMAQALAERLRPRTS